MVKVLNVRWAKRLRGSSETVEIGSNLQIIQVSAHLQRYIKKQRNLHTYTTGEHDNTGHDRIGA